MKTRCVAASEERESCFTYLNICALYCFLGFLGWYTLLDPKEHSAHRVLRLVHNFAAGLHRSRPASALHAILHYYCCSRFVWL